MNTQQLRAFAAENYQRDGTVPVAIGCLTCVPPRVVAVTRVSVPAHANVWTEDGARRWGRMIGTNHAHNYHGPQLAELVICLPAGDETFSPPPITHAQQAAGLITSGINPVTVIPGYTGAWPTPFWAQMQSAAAASEARATQLQEEADGHPSDHG